MSILGGELDTCSWFFFLSFNSSCKSGVVQITLVYLFTEEEEKDTRFIATRKVDILHNGIVDKGSYTVIPHQRRYSLICPNGHLPLTAICFMRPVYF
jgi:hypothetical protein